MRLAVVCSIGPLDRYGYQNVYQECIASMCSLGDLVLLISSTRSNVEALELAKKHTNMRLIAGPSTYFKRTKGTEVFDVQKVVDNVNYGLRLASVYECDCAIEIDVNQYVPNGSIDPLRARCADVLENGANFGWYYRRDYLDGQMFHASLRRPRIFRLPLQVTHTIDGIDGIINDSAHLHQVRGNWPEEDYAAIVDAQLEMTPKDWEEKLNFIRCYKELEPTRSETFEWGYWFDYMVRKYRKKMPGGELDEIGQVLLTKRNPDYVSSLVREAL